MPVFKDAKGNVKVKTLTASEAVTAPEFAGASKLPSYTVATLPAASAANMGSLVYCSDGAAGNPCLAFSSGSAWLQVAIGSAVSAS
jgi:hypothetical protein